MAKDSDEQLIILRSANPDAGLAAYGAVLRSAVTVLDLMVQNGDVRMLDVLDARETLTRCASLIESKRGN